MRRQQYLGRRRLERHSAFRAQDGVAEVDPAPERVARTQRLETLDQRDRHERLGFSDAQIGSWFEAAGLALERTETLPGGELTVTIKGQGRGGRPHNIWIPADETAPDKLATFAAIAIGYVRPGFGRRPPSAT